MSDGKQKGMILMVSESFLAEIDKAYPNLGYSDRASFVRAAVHEYLKENGVNLPMSYRAAPPRAGKSKGGRPRKAAEQVAQKEMVSSPQLVDLKTRKPKLKPVLGTGKSDEKAQAG